MPQDLSRYRNPLSFSNQCLRMLWTIVWGILGRPWPRSLGSAWKRFLLRLFGAKLASTAVVYSSARVFQPWNLEMGEHSCLAEEVDCYNVAPVRIGAHTTVSQRAFLCTASHDISAPNLPLVSAPIVIEDQAWIGAEAFIRMGVTVRQGAVVGARGAVFRDVEAWTVVGGNPAKFLKRRELR